MPEDTTRDRFIVIGEIAAEVAHELRNVLQVISASAFLAQKDPGKSAPHLAKIERNARAAHTIVDDLMSLARGEPAHAEPTLLYEVIVAARADIETNAAVWLDSVVPADVRVKAHAGLCTRLFHALYENAVHASAPRPPTITTRAFVDADRVIVEVQDDGPGVPAALADSLFDPLVTGRAGGTGLGLALARRIAVAHRGAITLLPCEEGARFRVTLPMAESIVRRSRK